jgi:hypothetical protein
MTTQLRVVNDCLAIMGETPLNSLQEEHDYKAAVLGLLSAENARMQVADGNGWWFNCETVTLIRNLADGRIYVPGDAGSVTIMNQRTRLVQRGNTLYNLEDGTDLFPEGASYVARLIRIVPFEKVPLTVAEYIAASVVLAFQNDYDGDQAKTRNLSMMVARAEVAAMRQHIRERQVNLFDASPGIARLRNITRQARRY